jgi:hypothetical protein
VGTGRGEERIRTLQVHVQHAAHHQHDITRRGAAQLTEQLGQHTHTHVAWRERRCYRCVLRAHHSLHTPHDLQCLRVLGVGGQCL